FRKTRDFGLNSDGILEITTFGAGVQVMDINGLTGDECTNIKQITVYTGTGKNASRRQSHQIEGCGSGRNDVWNLELDLNGRMNLNLYGIRKRRTGRRQGDNFPVKKSVISL